MPTVSTVFGITKSQRELDFVDVQVQTDNRLFVDPFALGQRVDRWSEDAHQSLVTFFDQIVQSIRSGKEAQARQLLSNLSEPNETRLGLSKERPQGAGIGAGQADDLYKAFKDSTAVKTGFLTSLEESELMIEGIGPDKISDLTTNVIRGHLLAYTAQQCELHGIPTTEVAMPACFDPQSFEWESRYARVPLYRGRPLMLVPKAIVRLNPAYDPGQYYRHYVLNFLQAEHLASGSSLVKTLKNGQRVVYKKDLEKRFPQTKRLLYDFSRKHPEILEQYRKDLARMEREGIGSEVDTEDERVIAGALQAALRSIQAGASQYQHYHNLMIGVVEFLFFPALFNPQKEREIHEGRKRIDITMENAAREGVFERLHRVRKLPCAYVFFECKNYIQEVGNPELDQLAGRFGINRGKLGFLCCRQFEDRGVVIARCKDTFQDDRGLIIPLEDRDILEMLRMILEGNRREIERRVSQLVDEIWL